MRTRGSHRQTRLLLLLLAQGLAFELQQLLGATRTEMLKMDDVLERLGKQAGAFSNTIEAARRRTRAVGRKLRGVEEIATERAEQLLELEGETLSEEQ